MQIVRSKKVKGITRHEVLINLGRKDEIENNPMYQRLAKKLLELSGLNEAKKSIEDSSEAIIRNWGYIVYKRLWNKFELNSCLEDIRKIDSKTTFNLAQTTFLMAIQHLLDPMSKLGTLNHQDRHAKLPELKLQHL